jgi:hypothetical protein
MLDLLITPCTFILMLIFDFSATVGELSSNIRRSFRRCLYTPEQLERERLQKRQRILDHMHSELDRLDQVVGDAEIWQSRPADDLRLARETLSRCKSQVARFEALTA